MANQSGVETTGADGLAKRAKAALSAVIYPTRRGSDPSLSTQGPAAGAKAGAAGTWVPPGHFYSPIADLNEVRAQERRLFDRYVREVPGIELHVEEQLALHARFLEFYPDVRFAPRPEAGRRYYYENDYFAFCDGFFMYSMIRHFRPRRIVEVGSGFSSALMLDTLEDLGETGTHCTFVEPYPERLRSLLRADDLERHRLVEAKVQDVPVTAFADLGENDILSIDSSHVTKTGSDVNYLFFEVLPRLAPGVVIHVHDIPFPFEYAEEVVYEGRSWNEAYLMRAFLQFNSDFELLFFPSLVSGTPMSADDPTHCGAAWARLMPRCLPVGPSLWLRRTRRS